MSAPGDGDGPFSDWFRPDDVPSAPPAAPSPAAATAGAGSVALPPELSPRAATGAAAVPAGRGRSRARTFARRLTGVVAATVVVGSGTGYALTNHYLGNVRKTDVFAEIPLGERAERLDVPAQNILVAGVDDRSNLTRKQKKRLRTGYDDYGKRSDTMILFHVSDKTRSISAISLPRDSLVTIPSYKDSNGVRRPATRNKLNAAYAFGGAELTIRTIEKNTNIHIDHYVEVDIPGFIRMVDAVGGVDVCVEEAVSDRDSGLDLPAGKSRLDGAEALAFVRARHIYVDQDLGRIRAQQRFLGSMIKKATSTGVLFNPVRLNRVLNDVLKSITTSMSRDDIVGYATRLRDYKPEDIRFYTVPLSSTNYRDPVVGSTVLWDRTESRAMFEKIRNDEPLTKPQTQKVTVAPGSISLRVLNGAGLQGLAGRAADALADLGFAIPEPPGNATVTGQTTTVVRHSPARAEAAKTVLAALPGSTAEEVPGLGRTIEVVVGSNFLNDGVAKVSIAQPRSTSTPAARSAADDVCG